MSRRTLTDPERTERRKADRERLERAARELLISDGWRRWVKVRSTNGLARYSFANQLVIALQRPDATYVGGFRAFRGLNRCVRKGEQGIRILASPDASAPAATATPEPRSPTSGGPFTAPYRSSTSPRSTRCPVPSPSRSTRPSSRSTATATPT